VWKRGLVWDGTNPLYLYGYGAYGLCSEPYFSSAVLSLLDRGFVFAIAHVRGGGELGREWYYEGRLLNKRNTFTDFIAVADYLVAQGYADRDKLVISGVSAGGLLIGAVLNMRPDLCRIAVADVPFVDIMNTMLDESIPLTVTEYEEWGNPNQREYFEYMLSYSPYDNVGAYRYPHMFVTAGLYDTRVAYWEPAKWVARIRATKTGDNTLILRTNMGAGHGGPSGRYSRLGEIAAEYAFILDMLAGPGAHK
jgi:oligopeptidase B